MRTALAIAAALTTSATPAHAQEVFAGVLAHAVRTPFTLRIQEGGTDFQLGVRSARIQALHLIGKPQAHLFASANSRGVTDFIAAGLDWKVRLHGPVFFRPGIGMAVHDGPALRIGPNYRDDLGSRVLFEPEIGLGAMLTPRLGLEARWTHLSHARLFSPQNPGVDMIGASLSLRL